MTFWDSVASFKEVTEANVEIETVKASQCQAQILVHGIRGGLVPRRMGIKESTKGWKAAL